MSTFELIAESIVYVLPAYAANGAPVVVVRMVGQPHPLDLGRSWHGRRLLGDGKTAEGLASGLAAGILAALSIALISPSTYRGFEEAFLLVVGAITGDLAGSFVKRRLGYPRGKSAPVLDQLGFIIVALVAASIPYGPSGWITPITLAAILLLTAILHLGTNALAYLLKIKDRWY